MWDTIKPTLWSALIGLAGALSGAGGTLSVQALQDRRPPVASDVRAPNYIQSSGPDICAQEVRSLRTLIERSARPKSVVAPKS